MRWRDPERLTDSSESPPVCGRRTKALAAFRLLCGRLFRIETVKSGLFFHIWVVWLLRFRRACPQPLFTRRTQNLPSCGDFVAAMDAALMPSSFLTDTRRRQCGLPKASRRKAEISRTGTTRSTGSIASWRSCSSSAGKWKTCRDSLERIDSPAITISHPERIMVAGCDFNPEQLPLRSGS